MRATLPASEMKKHIFYAMLGVFLPLFANCQFWEIGVMGGASNYMGDLSQSLITPSQTHGAGGAFVRYNLSPRWTLKGSVSYGTISGADSTSSDPNRLERNLSFRSRILDIAGTVEFNIWPYVAGNKRYYNTTLYPFIGLCVFHFNPEAYYQGNWVPLQPLGTEGQETTMFNDRTKYSLTQVGIPFGLGFKHNFGGNWNMGLEVGWRKTFTDYLDDVSTTYPPLNYLNSSDYGLSQALSNRSGEVKGRNGVPIDFYSMGIPRGNSSTDDWYIFAGFTISYTILPGSCYSF